MKNIFLLAVLLILSGCSDKVYKVPDSIKSEIQLQQLVLKALDGDENANDSLSNITDTGIPPPEDYNKVIIKEFLSLSGAKFYFVLLEHQNPLYNRFAVYDTLLNLHILNKNLNGILSADILNIDGFEFFHLKESFLSKDVLRIDRSHIYKVDSTEIYPVHEMFAGIRGKGFVYKQVIEELNNERIKTRIMGPDTTKRSSKGDVFVFNQAEKKFISSDNTFYQIVTSVLNNYNKKTELAEIKDSISALQSLGIKVTPDTSSVITAGTDRQGFSLTLDEGWKEIKNLVISDYMSQNLMGTKYVNSGLGSEISVISIPYKDSSENYVRYALPQKSEGKYKVRFSQKIESGKDYIQFFEYTCGRNKYLMIFRTSKYSFYNNKDVYENIINSFTMEC